MSMATSIQVSEELLGELKKMKVHDRETYEDIIWNLLEDTMELTEETKKDIEQSEREIKAGKIVSFEEIKKKYS